MLIFDIGAGTLDITALRRDGSNFQILGNMGRDAMGGSVFDDLILDQFIKHAKTTKRRNLRDDSKLLVEAKMKAEALKCVLSTVDEASMEVSNISMTLTRADFNAIIAPNVRKMSQAVWDLLSELNLEPEDIDLVVMVGGGSRVPALSAMLGAMFDNIRSDININECVAMGAALYQRTANEQDDIEPSSVATKSTLPQLSIVDVVPMAFGIKTKGNRFSTIIAKNAPLPAVHKQIFYPYSRKQNFANINIYQGIVTDDPQLIDDTFVLIDSLVLNGIQKNRPQIVIEFRINNDGMLEINATSEGTSITGKTIVANMKPNVNDNIEESESESE
jgi:molecular chaperone DnaK (HSP70)